MNDNPRSQASPASASIDVVVDERTPPRMCRLVFNTSNCIYPMPGLPDPICFKCGLRAITGSHTCAPQPPKLRVSHCHQSRHISCR